MYDLPDYHERNETIIREFIAKYPFAFLTGSDDKGMPVATQVPVFIEEEGEKKFLRGHIMRNTDHHKAWVKNPNVLVVFTGPHCYVSATWYSNPHQASTWNYMSVHAKGVISFLDQEALIRMLRKTSLYFEKDNQASTTFFDNLTDEYTRPLMKAIVPFEIEIQSLENVFKLSQNRDEKSFENIIEKLKELGGDSGLIAAEMEMRKDELFQTGTASDVNKFIS